MARTARAGGPPPAPPPWHQRYRLILLLGALAALALITAALVAGILRGGGEPPTAAAAERGQALRPLTSAIETAPADLPPGWTPLAAGPGFQGTPRTLDMGPATTVAESDVGNARSWVLAGDPRLLGAGVIVAETPPHARVALERLRGATPEETVASVEPQAEEIVAVAPCRRAAPGPG